MIFTHYTCAIFARCVKNAELAEVLDASLQPNILFDFDNLYSPQMVGKK